MTKALKLRLNPVPPPPCCYCATPIKVWRRCYCAATKPWPGPGASGCFLGVRSTRPISNWPQATSTWFILLQLRDFDRVDDALRTLGALQSLHVLPVFGTIDGAEIAMFEGYAGYHNGEAEYDGPRHRVRPDGGKWIYEYGDLTATVRPLDGRDLR